nr:MAG: putative nucleotide kinase [Candidatus Nanosalinarum sp. J07AB56]
MDIDLSLTGTPGTGKTSVAEELESRGYEVSYLSRLLEQKGIGDAGEEREVDVDEMRSRLEIDADIVEGHLSHFLSADVCVVLRCRPDVLRDRLSGRGYSSLKIEENLRAEALDAVLQQALGNQDVVVELDTTDVSLPDVADSVEESLNANESDYGQVDFSDFLRRV